MYVYKATVVRVIDGDTVRLNVDVGFNLRTTQNFRLVAAEGRGLNAPEIRGEERPDGLKSKARAAELMPVGASVHIETFKTGKFGRWLASVASGGVDVGSQLIEEGLAEFKEY